MNNDRRHHSLFLSFAILLICCLVATSPLAMWHLACTCLWGDVAWYWHSWGPCCGCWGVMPESGEDNKDLWFKKFCEVLRIPENYMTFLNTSYTQLWPHKFPSLQNSCIIGNAPCVEEHKFNAGDSNWSSTLENKEKERKRWKQTKEWSVRDLVLTVWDYKSQPYQAHIVNKLLKTVMRVHVQSTICMV